MGFEVVSQNPILVWGPVTNADTLYVGQLVKSSGDGFAPLGQASGAYDTSTEAVVYGVVVGTNDLTPTYDSTYKNNSIAGVAAQATQLARKWVGVEGVGRSKGDPQAMVQVARIFPHTILKGQIFNSSFGTAPTVVAISAASTDGLSVTSTATSDAANVADFGCSYFRTGANAGFYRIRDDSSNSAGTVDIAYPYDIAVGDTHVHVNIRPIGLSKVQTDTESTFFDCSAAVTTNYWGIDVLGLDLSTAGQEHVIFTFNGTHFSAD